jgi:hypothetical protein
MPAPTRSGSSRQRGGVADGLDQLRDLRAIGDDPACVTRRDDDIGQARDEGHVGVDGADAVVGGDGEPAEDRRRDVVVVGVPGDHGLALGGDRDEFLPGLPAAVECVERDGRRGGARRRGSQPRRRPDALVDLDVGGRV